MTDADQGTVKAAELQLLDLVGKELHFPGGLLGFPDCQRYKISRFDPGDGSDSPFFILESTGHNLSFTLIHPDFVVPDYELPVSPELLSSLMAHSDRDLVAMLIVTLRDRADSPCPGVPLVTHAYDLVTPRDSPARFLVAQQGPWLYPAMVAARIPQNRWNDVADFLLGELGKCLVDLEAELPNFHVARTQGRLTRAAAGTHGNSHDWANEIHPNGKGFRELGKPLADLIDALT